MLFYNLHLLIIAHSWQLRGGWISIDIAYSMARGFAWDWNAVVRLPHDQAIHQHECPVAAAPPGYSRNGQFDPYCVFREAGVDPFQSPLVEEIDIASNGVFVLLES